MEKLNARLDCFDDAGKDEIIKYLNKCVTRFFKTKIRSHRKTLEKHGVDKDHIDDLCTLRMLNCGLITREDASKMIHNINARVI